MPVLPQIVFKIAKYLASSQIATILDTDKIISSVYVWKFSAGIEKIPKKLLRLKRLIEFPYSLCSDASDKCLFMALNCIFFLKSIKKNRLWTVKAICGMRFWYANAIVINDMWLWMSYAIDYEGAQLPPTRCSSYPQGARLTPVADFYKCLYISFCYIHELNSLHRIRK